MPSDSKGASPGAFATPRWLAVLVAAALVWITAPCPLAALGLAPGAGIAVHVDQDCAAAQRRGFAAVLGRAPAPSARSRRPAKGEVRIDPEFHSCVVRATDHAVEPPTNFARNDYARRQAFNADNSRFIVYASGGAWHLYDANTLAYIRQLDGPNGAAEPQWDAADPDSLYYLPTSGGMSLLKLDVESNRSSVAADFTGKLIWPKTARAWTRSEGSPSADGRYWCFLAETSGFDILGVFTYDLQAQKILGTHSLVARPDHVSMSPSGRYCVVSSDAKSGGTVAWNPRFTSSRLLHSGTEHSDLAIGPNGNDQFVFVDYQSDGDLVMVDLDTGARTKLFSTYIDGTATSYHVSGKGYSRPGWILLSTYHHTGTEKWLHERVMAVELKANPKIINLAHHHAYYNGYWTEPHATISRDFTHALFNSNWGTTSSMDVDAYMIRLPGDLLGAGNASIGAGK